MYIIKLAIVWFQIRAMEATIQGQMDVIPLLRGEQRDRVIFAHKAAEAELCRLKAKYRKLCRGNGIEAWRTA